MARKQRLLYWPMLKADDEDIFEIANELKRTCLKRHYNVFNVTMKRSGKLLSRWCFLKIKRIVMIKYLKIIFAVFLLISLTGAGLLDDIEDNNLPNIVFYLSDDQNIVDYGCYGNEVVRTPAVDALARQGMRFTQAFTAQAICAPSRSQLFTGKYPMKNGCFLNHTGVKHNLVAVSEYLHDLGYEVVLAGKEHVKPASVFDWDVEFPILPLEGNPHGILPLEDIRNYMAGAQKPFCMFIASTFPHVPYPELEEGEIPDSSDVKFYPFDKKRSLETIYRYYKSIDENNDQLEQVLSYLDQYGLTDNTLFIYSADHGVAGKWTTYDAGLNVPLVIRWPKVVEPGSVSDQLVQYVDILPTFIDIAGGDTDITDFDGKSILPILLGKDTAVHEFVYGVRHDQNIIACSVFPSRMIRDKKYKYIVNYNSVEVLDKNLIYSDTVNAFIRIGAEKQPEVPYEELYNVENDPYEQKNLAAMPEYASVKARLSEELVKWMTEQHDVLIEHGPMPLLPAPNNPLDEYTGSNKIPAELIHSLKDSDYVQLHY